MRLTAALVSAGLVAIAGVAACGPKVQLDPMPIEHDDPRAGAAIDDPVVDDAPPAASAERAGAAAVTTPAAPPRPAAPPGAGARTGTIARASLIAVLDQGPGPFLRGFEVDAVRSGQRFAGWRLVQYMDGEHRFDGLDLVPGDVLVAVNGQPLSQPDQLAALWDSLRAANEIVCDLSRGGAPFQLRFAITPAVGPGATPRPAPSTAAATPPR